MSKRKVSKQPIHKLFAYHVMNHSGDRAARRFARIAYADRFAKWALFAKYKPSRAYIPRASSSPPRAIRDRDFPIRASRARRSPCVNGESLFTAFRTLRYSADALQNHRRDAIDVARGRLRGKDKHLKRHALGACSFQRIGPFNRKTFSLIPPIRCFVLTARVGSVDRRWWNI